MRKEAEQSKENTKDPARVAKRQSEIRAQKLQYTKTYKEKLITPTVPLPKSVYTLRLAWDSADSAHRESHSWGSGPVCFRAILALFTGMPLAWGCAWQVN